ncbi:MULTISPECIES: TRAP transporter small permease [unclassified Modicisalibacter]|uniref:TRAP transporter small permease n=1 Tax=unclassified Modicisalibacter TaxID=2679913 RepID=UPI001CCD2BFA|nr:MULTISPECIES: TRAP transporter small permease [unclassified Modicisalibacter]MBZ9558510.1 TRAP transporter small permease subunit [Modicisalibacter sp. R2A 31.J]MBZ9575598.1 TRAP transporter small permease subunit [Modicisalibacter sp. MOD 31.J]
MRALLNGLYLASGVFAALFLALIGVSILVQIGGRALGFVVDATEFSGFCLAASTFLGLANALRHGTHVRVGLLVQALGERARRIVELVVCLIAAGVVGWLCWCAALYTRQTYDFCDISPGLIAAPLWIPQTGMTLGLAIMAVALLDDAWQHLRGATASYIANDQGALE